MYFVGVLIIVLVLVVLILEMVWRVVTMVENGWAGADHLERRRRRALPRDTKRSVSPYF